MHLAVTDGGEGGEHHVEAVKPAPALDIVKARRADQGYAKQSGR